MPTGACGINCDVCKLRLLGTCSTCGSGKSIEARKKLDAQKRIFGAGCPVLECACMNNLEYCMRDCSLFPCENFRLGPYPFSRSFLDMQARRLRERPPAFTPNKTLIKVPPEYWDNLRERDINMLCNFTLADPHPPDSPGSHTGLVFHFLKENVLADIENRCLKRFSNNQWEKTDDPLLELITLVYLNNVKSFHPLNKDIISTEDLKEGHFFKGPHKLKTEPLLERYGNDLHGFRSAAENLEGKAVDMADAAYMLLPFPRVPLYYLLWKGDEEFKPRISILFDRSIEDYFEADAIWGLVNMVSLELLRG